MSRYLETRGINRFGRSRNGNSYRHLLVEEDAIHNFLGDERILEEVERRYGSHKAGDLSRTKTNTVASTPLCFNLFAPLKRNRRLASELFSTLLARRVEVAHVEIEFTPNRCDDVDGFERRGDADETIGDQRGDTGTDADTAVFYRDGAGKRGVILIEVKYIEAEFSRCTSYARKPDIRSSCDANDFHRSLIAPHLKKPAARPKCGYLKFENWALTAGSELIASAKVASATGCPFKGSLNQLWRNMLLVERVRAARALDDVHFWVLAPAKVGENQALWADGGRDVEDAFRALFTPAGLSAFRRLELRRDVLASLRPLVRAGDESVWLDRLCERYA